MMDYIASSKSVYTLFILLSVNHLGNMFGCRIQELLTKNMFVKHLLGIIAMYTFVVYVGHKNYNLKQRIFVSITYYIWFVLVARTDYRFTVVIIVIFMLINEIDAYKTDENAEQLDELIKILFAINVMLTIIGVTLYYRKQRSSHTKEWDIKKFLLGIPKCRNLA